MRLPSTSDDRLSFQASTTADVSEELPVAVRTKDALGGLPEPRLPCRTLPTMEKWFPIRTARLVLREFRESDESDLHEYGGNLEVSKYVVWGPNTPEDTRHVLNHRIEKQRIWPRNEVDLAIELCNEEKVIGSVSLVIQCDDDRIASFGYAVNRRYWGQGYATEAADAFLSRAFQELGLHRVWATCDVRNVASWRVMEKVGMKREGAFRRDVFQKGEWRDSYLYARLDGEEAANRAETLDPEV